jgi:hypothetical protein
VFGGGEFYEGLNVLRASTAAASVFQPKLGFDLAGQDDASTRCIADIRICDSFAQAQIHERLPATVTIMRSILSMA